MAISRAQLAKELEPGLNALFGMEYSRYENQHAEIFTMPLLLAHLLAVTELLCVQLTTHLLPVVRLPTNQQ
jgi:hypothetical protein